jgi:predicted nucleotidyltransferase
MKSSEALNLHRKESRDIVEQHRAKNARVFGSVASYFGMTKQCNA